ncbi:MAG: tRNA (guanosine(37)-N1)-methyltransferase TrmD [Desulfotomaculum sp.]|nr:tRNA (guanosine(37)-N1)-methyltransferase TrmD [Desulfotomaculum sp.]
MRIDILTLFPEMFAGPFDTSIIKRARDKGIIDINIFNIRDFSQNKHRTVDDTPYGGGAGMVMQAEPVFKAVEHLRELDDNLGRVIMMCPQGMPFNQELAKEFSREKRLVLLCGHYEGIDERVREKLVTDEISIGDYVLTGGELPAMVVVDAVARMIPGVLGEMASAEADSFYNGILEHPHYTKPRLYEDMEVPEVLLSGHHKKIQQWRRRQSLMRTLERRPELLKNADLTDEDMEVLREVYQLLKGILSKK